MLYCNNNNTKKTRQKKQNIFYTKCLARRLCIACHKTSITLFDLLFQWPRLRICIVIHDAYSKQYLINAHLDYK